MPTQKPNQKSYKVEICDECMTAAYDEGAVTKEQAETICTTLGNEIPDHTCVSREEPGTRCDCLCNQNE